MNGEIVRITNSAHRRLSDLAKRHNTRDLFFSVNGGGCNSFNFRTYMKKNSYKYNIEPMKYNIDGNLNCIKRDNYNLHICDYSKKHLINSVIDWKSEFMCDRFVFENPNSEYNYKCGNSFISKYK